MLGSSSKMSLHEFCGTVRKSYVIYLFLNKLNYITAVYVSATEPNLSSKKRQHTYVAYKHARANSLPSFFYLTSSWGNFSQEKPPDRIFKPTSVKPLPRLNTDMCCYPSPSSLMYLLLSFVPICQCRNNRCKCLIQSCYRLHLCHETWEINLILTQIVEVRWLLDLSPSVPLHVTSHF